MKQLIQQSLRRFGYRLERIRPDVQFPIDVFDLVIKDLMLRTRPNLFFVQIGANDGVSHDPIRSFIKKHHWSGVLIEPVPWIFEQLKKNYQDDKQLQFENVAISQHDGESTLFVVRKNDAFPDWANELASFNKDVLLSHAPLIPGLESHVEGLRVTTLSVPTLLKRHAIDRIDVLQIDTEGYDYEILKMFDLKRIRPSVIQFEHTHLSRDQRQECFSHLVTNGYRFATVGGDTVASCVD